MQMNLDGSFGDTEYACDLAIGGAEFQHLDDLLLTSREVALRAARRRRPLNCRQVIGGWQSLADDVRCDFAQPVAQIFGRTLVNKKRSAISSSFKDVVWNFIFSQKTNSRLQTIEFHLPQNLRRPGLRNVHIDQGHGGPEAPQEFKALNAGLSDSYQLVEVFGRQHMLDARTHQWVIVDNNNRKP